MTVRWESRKHIAVCIMHKFIKNRLTVSIYHFCVFMDKLKIGYNIVSQQSNLPQYTHVVEPQ